MTARASVLLLCLLVEGQGDTLILKDGTKVSGRWWSIDASQVHFLVNNQLEHYSRADLSAVTFGDATLPQPPAPSTPPPVSATPPMASATPSRAATPQLSDEAARAPTLTRPSEGSRPQPPSLTRPSGSAASPRGVSQPEEIGMVYFWNGRDLTPLERSQAAERKSGSKGYWEIAGPQSRVRIKEASEMAFIVRLPKGVDPAGYSLFLLSTVNGNRQTQTQAGRRSGLMTWPFKIEINNESGYMTYAFRVTDLPTGEYSFSPSSSNEAYCFGVD